MLGIGTGPLYTFPMQEICAYFGVLESHQLIWRHRVNSEALLERYCEDPNVMMLEGDVLMTPFTPTPMMASPFSVDGEMQPGTLDFATWLQTAIAYNKGIKVDLQTAATVLPVLEMLNEADPSIPVILHADVFNLLGHGEDTFEPEQLVHMAQKYFPQATLSLGWSLRRGQDTDGKLEQVIIDQMSTLVLERLGGVAYTIELRAGYTPQWEKGAAFILEPIDGAARPEFADNVVDGIAHFRQDVFSVAE